jgi:site-specific recombinase XerD
MVVMENLPTPAESVKQFAVILPEALAHKDFNDVAIHSSGRVKQIAADTDIEAVTEWLLGFADSPKTIRAYRREAERFLLYLQTFRPKATLQKLMLGDLRAYESFVRDPPADWVSPVKRPRQDPAWRPFAGPLSKSSHRHAMLILKAMMGWLQAAGYAATNPFELDKKKWRLKKTTAAITRYLSQAAIQDMFDAVEAMPADTKARALEKVRGRFMLALYYDSALRLFEPVNVNMSAIERDLLGGWISIIGKGDKPGRVPLSPRTLEAFDAYRQLLGLTGQPEDSVPLLVAARGDRRRATEGTIAKALERIMKSAAELARTRNREMDAMQLEQATPHWLRHSRVSHLINSGKNVQRVRALARHESLQTTGIYSHAEQIELQQLVQESSPGVRNE